MSLFFKPISSLLLSTNQSKFDLFFIESYYSHIHELYIYIYIYLSLTDLLNKLKTKVED